jgi:predicted nuclease of predicted toxin-antitoxin system
VRVLLDAHVSARGVGRPLSRSGHDVLALHEHAIYDDLADHEVLALAAEEGRILITHDVEDFPLLLREWAAEGRSHAGVVLILGIGNHEFGAVVDGLLRLFEARPAQRAWIDLCEVLSRRRFES